MSGTCELDLGARSKRKCNSLVEIEWKKTKKDVANFTLVDLLHDKIEKSNIWYGFFVFAFEDHQLPLPKELTGEMNWSCIRQRYYRVNHKYGRGIFLREVAKCKCCFMPFYPTIRFSLPPPHCVDRAFALTRQLGLHPCDLHMWVRQLIISAFQSHVRYLVRSVTGYVLNDPQILLGMYIRRHQTHSIGCGGTRRKRPLCDVLLRPCCSSTTRQLLTMYATKIPYLRVL
jgi:hypothetical protein